jgi:hypothetical protein
MVGETRPHRSARAQSAPLRFRQKLRLATLAIGQFNNRDSMVVKFATASLIEVWLDETEKRTWFLFEATRDLTVSRGRLPGDGDVPPVARVVPASIAFQTGVPLKGGIENS